MVSNVERRALVPGAVCVSSHDLGARACLPEALTGDAEKATYGAFAQTMPAVGRGFGTAEAACNSALTLPEPGSIISGGCDLAAAGSCCCCCCCHCNFEFEISLA